MGCGVKKGGKWYSRGKVKADGSDSGGASAGGAREGASVVEDCEKESG